MKVLNGHPYHNNSDESLRYIIMDANEAAKCAHEMGNCFAENRYLDQVNDASTILYYRQKNKKSS